MYKSRAIIIVSEALKKCGDVANLMKEKFGGKYGDEFGRYSRTIT